MKKRGSMKFLDIRENEIVLSKKGLSSLIVTILMVVLSLIAIATIWSVTQNFVKDKSSQIGINQFTLDLKIEKVQINGENISATIKRNSGIGNLTGINFIFSNGDNSEVISKNVSLKELERKTFNFKLNKFSASSLISLSVAPIYEKDGKDIMGNAADEFKIQNNNSNAQVISNNNSVQNNTNKFQSLGYDGAGEMDYSFSSNSPQNPEFEKAVVNPLDVLPGDIQNFSVEVYSPNGIANVTSVTELDNSISNLNFVKTGEYTQGNKTIEIWNATWIVNDTHTTEYRTKITAFDKNGNSNFINLTWTDSCASQITQGSTSTISTSCSTGTNAVEGVDGASVTIGSSATLTIDSGATWVFNSGTSITVQGTITVNGQITKGYLFYVDSDGDTYRASNTLSYSSSTSSSGHVRAKDAPKTGGTSNNGVDCYDSNGNAKPGQTTYFGTNRGDGSYDYNCDGSQSKQYTGTSAQCAICTYEPPCTTTLLGHVGYTASSTPACGSSATYVSSTGATSCNGLSSSFCNGQSSGCTSGSQQQKCR